MSKIKGLYWKLFFSAYWVAKDLGEKDSPERKACGLVEITFAIILFSILNIITFINGEKPDWYLTYIISSMVISYSFNEFIIYSKKIGFKTKMKSFEYLSYPLNKKKRGRIVLLIILFNPLIMTLTAIINNPNVKQLIFNKM